MPKVKPTGKMLKWARETANISIEKVASRLKKNPITIINWEEEKEFPTYIQLEILAYDLYKRPLALFFYPEPPEEPISSKSFRTLPEFEYQRLNTSVIKLIRMAGVMIINLKELCNDYNPSPKNLLKDIRIENIKEINEISKEIRSFINVSLAEQISFSNLDAAFKRWRLAFEDSGIFVFKEAFRQNGVSGFSLYDKEFPVIYINNSLPLSRQIFTLFHELGHLLMKTSGIVKIEEDYLDALLKKEKEVEIFCNKFTGEFLVPSYDFKKKLDSISLDEESISGIAEHYSVSREVILRKLYDIGRMSKELYEIYSKKWINQAIKERQAKTGKGGGNYYNNKKVYLGKKYLELVFGEYYKNRINLEQVANYLDVKPGRALNFESEIIFSEK